MGSFGFFVLVMIGVVVAAVVAVLGAIAPVIWIIFGILTVCIVLLVIYYIRNEAYDASDIALGIVVAAVVEFILYCIAYFIDHVFHNW